MWVTLEGCERSEAAVTNHLADNYRGLRAGSSCSSEGSVSITARTSASFDSLALSWQHPTPHVTRKRKRCSPPPPPPSFSPFFLLQLPPPLSITTIIITITIIIIIIIIINTDCRWPSYDKVWRGCRSFLSVAQIWFGVFLSIANNCSMFFLSLSLSLSHTHTHTYSSVVCPSSLLVAVSRAASGPAGHAFEASPPTSPHHLYPLSNQASHCQSGWGRGSGLPVR